MMAHNYDSYMEDAQFIEHLLNLDFEMAIYKIVTNYEDGILTKNDVLDLAKILKEHLINRGVDSEYQKLLS